MPDVKIEFSGFAAPARGVLVVFCDESLKLGPATRKALGEGADMVARAAAADHFKGKLGSTLDIVAPAGLRASRLVVVGCGKPAELKIKDFARLGGVAAGKIPLAAGAATIFAELAERRDEAGSGRRNRAWAPGCAAIRSTATRPRRRTMSPSPPTIKVTHRGRQCCRRAQGVDRAWRSRRRRDHRARPRQRAAECSVSGGIRAPRHGVAQARRRRRSARRQGDAKARHGRAARRRAKARSTTAGWW